MKRKDRNAKQRKADMSVRRERLQAVLFWTLIGLDFDVEWAERVASDQERNALPFAKWVGRMNVWDYEACKFASSVPE